MSLKTLIGLAAAFVTASTAGWSAEAPPVGVYGCYDARMGVNAPGCIRSSMGCMGLVITPMPVVMFGLIDASTYSDYDGHHGHYTFDPGTGILQMVDGSRQGWRYHKVDNWAFRLIDNVKGTDIYTCPLEPKKNPARGPW